MGDDAVALGTVVSAVRIFRIARLFRLVRQRAVERDQTVVAVLCDQGQQTLTYPGSVTTYLVRPEPKRHSFSCSVCRVLSAILRIVLGFLCLSPYSLKAVDS